MADTVEVVSGAATETTSSQATSTVAVSVSEQRLSSCDCGGKKTAVFCPAFALVCKRTGCLELVAGRNSIILCMKTLLVSAKLSLCLVFVRVAMLSL